jgi:DNA-binding Xre family transcriptional regulator
MARLQCNLGSILEARNISALSLSQAIDHRKNTIYELINNVDMDKKRIPASLIANVCEYLEISPNDLFSIIKE